MNPGFIQSDDHPVVCVNWYDARAYTRWLSQETGEEYRLLSEAEWEYVARAGTTTQYWWGDSIGRNQANCVDCGSRWDGEGTAPVGSFSANAFGVFDVSGNVTEWVEDCYNANYNGAPSDGTAWGSEGCDRPRFGSMQRSGDWYHAATTARSAARLADSVITRRNSSGFRVARTITP